MDPFSVTASVAGIATACLLTAKALNNLKSKFQDAQMTIVAISAETMIIGTTLAKIQSILLNNPHVLTAETQETPGLEIQATFDIAITGCAVIYSCLDIEVQKLKQYASGSELPGWSAKAKVYWKDDTMKELLVNLRGQQGAISLLISVLQIETTADIHRILKEKEKTDVLESTAGRTRSLRALYPQSKAPELIFDADEAGRNGDTASVVGSSIFGFDDKLVDSNVYRRTLKAAWKRSSKSKNDLANAESDADTIGDKTLTLRNNPQTPSFKSSIQDFSSSALALRRCDESVMGLWATGTVRKYRALEFRFEVIFQTPVIFLSVNTSLTAQRGPFGNREIYYLTGTSESYRNTLMIPGVSDQWQSKTHDAQAQKPDDTYASWLKLLTALQESEPWSRDWDHKQNKQVFRQKPTYGIFAALQKKSSSWDFMPQSVNKVRSKSAGKSQMERGNMCGAGSYVRHVLE